MFGGGAVSAMSFKQKCVALSSSQAEYHALSEAAREGVHLLKLFDDLHVAVQRPIKIFSDSQVAMTIAESPALTASTKHVDTRYHFVRDLVEAGEVKTTYLQSNQLPADLLTKSLPGDRTTQHRRAILGNSADFRPP